MIEPNAYEPPQTDSEPVNHPREPKQPTSLFLIIVPTLVGAFIGSTHLAPFVRGPGDPDGDSIGAGLGGLSGLAVGILLRIAIAWVSPESDGDSTSTAMALKTEAGRDGAATRGSADDGLT